MLQHCEIAAKKLSAGANRVVKVEDIGRFVDQFKEIYLAEFEYFKKREDEVV